MAQIEGAKGDIVSVKLTDAWMTHHEVNGETKWLVKLKGEDADGNTGTAAMWMDEEICTRGLDSRIGNTNTVNAMADLAALGLPDNNLRKLCELIGKRCEFYISPKKKDDGKVVYNYYLQTGGEVRADLEEGAAFVESLLGKEATGGGATATKTDDDFPF